MANTALTALKSALKEVTALARTNAQLERQVASLTKKLERLEAKAAVSTKPAKPAKPAKPVAEKKTATPAEKKVRKPRTAKPVAEKKVAPVEKKTRKPRTPKAVKPAAQPVQAAPAKVDDGFEL